MNDSAVTTLGIVCFLAGGILGKCAGKNEQLRIDKSALVAAIIEKHDDPRTSRDIVGKIGIIEDVDHVAILKRENLLSIDGEGINIKELITTLATERTDSRDVEAPTPAEEISNAQ